MQTVESKNETENPSVCYYIILRLDIDNKTHITFISHQNTIQLIVSLLSDRLVLNFENQKRYSVCTYGIPTIKILYFLWKKKRLYKSSNCTQHSIWWWGWLKNLFALTTHRHLTQILGSMIFVCVHVKCWFIFLYMKRLNKCSTFNANFHQKYKYKKEVKIRDALIDPFRKNYFIFINNG